VPRDGIGQAIGTSSDLIIVLAPVDGKQMGKIVNPYSVTSKTPPQTGFFGQHATRRDAAFLYRVIEIRHPVEAELVYSGWWFRQTIDIAGERVWSQISWLSIAPKVEFRLPESIAPSGLLGRIEIDFARGLRIRRFRVWIDDQLVYDEVV